MISTGFPGNSTGSRTPARGDPGLARRVAGLVEAAGLPCDTDTGRGLDCFKRMVRDEGIRIARKLIATGLDPQIPVLLSGAPQFFASSPEFHGTKPFPLDLLARQRLSTEDN